MENKLIINSSKTSTILFGTRNQINDHEYETLIDNFELVNSTRFLGVCKDGFLDWRKHVDNLCLRLRSIGYGVKVLSEYFYIKMVRIIYYANFESVLRYGILFWGSNSEIQSFCITEKMYKSVK